MIIPALLAECLQMQAGDVKEVSLEEEPIHGELGELRFSLLKTHTDRTFLFKANGKNVTVQCYLRHTASQ
jgi:hypothetical protein